MTVQRKQAEFNLKKNKKNFFNIFFDTHFLLNEINTYYIVLCGTNFQGVRF